MSSEAVTGFPRLVRRQPLSVAFFHPPAPLPAIAYRFMQPVSGFCTKGDMAELVLVKPVLVSSWHCNKEADTLAKNNKDRDISGLCSAFQFPEPSALPFLHPLISPSGFPFVSPLRPYRTQLANPGKA